MIISVTNLKGGSGKTTIAINLAVGFAHSGKSVCIVDTDNILSSSSQWAEGRNETLPTIPVFNVKPEKFTTEVSTLVKSYDILIIDGNATSSDSLDRFVLASDLLVIPVMPSLFDLSSLEKSLALFDEIKTVKEEYGGIVQAFVLINGLISNTKLSNEIVDAVRAVIKNSSNVSMLRTKIKRRAVYGSSPTNNMGVIEENHKKAKQEIISLVKELSKKGL